MKLTLMGLEVFVVESDKTNTNTSNQDPAMTDSSSLDDSSSTTSMYDDVKAALHEDGSVVVVFRDADGYALEARKVAPEDAKRVVKVMASNGVVKFYFALSDSGEAKSPLAVYLDEVEWKMVATVEGLHFLPQLHARHIRLELMPNVLSPWEIAFALAEVGIGLAGAGLPVLLQFEIAAWLLAFMVVEDKDDGQENAISRLFFTDADIWKVC